MAQVNSFTIPANQSGTAFRTQANNIFSALASLNTGATAPVNPQRGMLWLDISNPQKHYLKIRNSANNAWGTLFECNAGEAEFKVSGIDSSAFIQKTQGTLISELAHVTHSQILPDGDYSSPDFWLSVKPGIYYSTREKGRNGPFVYGLVEIISNGEISITWSYFGEVWKWYQGFNKSSSGWKKVVLGNVSSASGANSIVARDANGDFEGRWIAAAHFRLGAETQNDLFSADSEIIFRTGPKKNENYLRGVSFKRLIDFLGTADATAGTLVRRNADSDFAGRYISATSFKSIAGLDDNLINAQSGIMYWSPTDKFMRPASLAKIKEFLSTNLQGSLGTNGYTKLPNGLIMQWGAASSWDPNQINIALPVAFPNSPIFGIGAYTKIGNSGRQGSTPYPGKYTDNRGQEQNGEITIVGLPGLSRTNISFYSSKSRENFNYIAFGY